MAIYNTKRTLPYLAPALLVLALIAVYPVAYALYSSFFDWHMHRPAMRSFIGLQNFIELIGNERFQNSYLVSLNFSFLSVSMTLILGFLIALLIEKPFKGKNIVRALMLVPMIMTPVITGLIWKVFFYEPQIGLVNWFLSIFGVTQEIAWLSHETLAFYAVLLVDIWIFIPLVMLLLDAALAGIPPAIVDSAKVDGAGYWKTIFSIKIPMIKATFLFMIIFRLTTSFRTFDIIYLMTEGGPGQRTQVLSMFVYRRAMRSFQIGQANAAAVLMLLTVGVICALIIYFGFRKEIGRELLK